MQGASRRRALASSGVVAGSVWEARMRVDAVNGGVKVFNAGGGDGDGDEEGMRVYRRLRRNQSDSIASARKRRIWTPPLVEGRSPIQLRKAREATLLAIGDGGEGAMVDVGIEDDDRWKSFDDKEMDLPAERRNTVVDEEEKTINQVHETPVSSPAVDKFHDCLAPSQDAEQRKGLNHRTADPDPADPPVLKFGKKSNRPLILPSPAPEKKMMNQSVTDPDPADTNPYAGKKLNRFTINPDPVGTPSFDGASELYETSKKNHNRLQSIVDLVMWRDVPRTALVFGLGTFILVSSSYAEDLNFRLISATSYSGLIYLALIFIYKSILRRGELEYDERDERYMVGEEEAIWILRLLLPYLNEVLFKMRVLFSGDPAAIMKMAVLLFVMAKCGGSITIWTLSKLMFFGVFAVPKIYTSYTTQLLKFGKFWRERLRDGWESCTYKKAVAAAIFTIIWSISSTAGRTWAVFMLAVAFKLYQQRLSHDCNNQEAEVMAEEVAMAQEEVPKAGHHRYSGP
ncbi:reticulon-like protein B21 isoform X1 [Zingiber officinale]|uniref:reticulon-like protein B21 isoform X1 n=1 Tax=Zingiber officinale TaxID=94328 RepID=UPI001C4D508A|nr:reticulon-like protein B21 isoform X1 [Zingiber officinale]